MLDSAIVAQPTVHRDKVPARHAHRRRRAAWAWLSVVLAACCAAGAASVLVHRMTLSAPAASPRAASEPAVLAVTVVPAEIRPLVRSVIGDGSVVPWQELIVSAETAGLRVAELAADEGDQVRRGQVLARFDDSLLVAQLAQAEAAVTEADALR